MKRHFQVGHSSRSPKETYRIDHTSIDGSGLQRDDGDSRNEQHLDDEVEALHPPTQGLR
jgi:hypothetical protein